VTSGPVPQQPARSIAGGALLAASARVGFVFGGALVTVLVARLLGPDDSGGFLVISSLLLTLITLSTLGLEIGAAWMVASERWPLRSALASSGLAAVALGLLGASIGMAIYGLSSDSAFEGIELEVALLAMAALPPALVVTIYAQLAIAIERYEAALVMSGTQAIVYVAGVAVLAAALDLDGAAAGLFAGWVAGALVALAWGRRAARNWEGERGSIEATRIRQALAFGIKLYAANAAAILIYRFDVFLLNAYAGSAEAGYYAVAIAATTALVVLPTALGNVLFPRLASLSDGEADEPRRREVQDQAVRHTVLIVIVSSLLLAAALPVLTEPVFGEEFGPAVVPGLILIPGAAALGLATTFYSALAGRERPEYAMWIALITTPAAIGLYFVLIPWLAAEGAALGSDVAYISSAVMAAVALRRVSGPSEGIRAVLPGRAELKDYKVLARQVRHRFRRGLFKGTPPVEAPAAAGRAALQRTTAVAGVPSPAGARAAADGAGAPVAAVPAEAPARTDPPALPDVPAPPEPATVPEAAEVAPDGLPAEAPPALDVAVVIPHYNHGRYIADAVTSALAQDVGRPRVVVVDDGSTDPEAEAALAALPEGVELIRQPNAGQAAARNAGALATTEPLLLFLDADDRLPPDAIGSLREALVQDPQAAYAYGRMRYFGAWSGVVEFPPFDPFRLLYRSVVGWIGLVRREAFQQVGGFAQEQAGFEDWDLMLAFLEQGWGAVGIDPVVLEYRKHHDTSALESHRNNYRRHYRELRRRHAGLYERAPELAARTDLSPAGRMAYRTWWAWRPLPARLERTLYGMRFGR
jgi:O-antigen/teichoic acid export membrane protein/glycosyltransferase involved in cell wall biosynthesis